MREMKDSGIVWVGAIPSHWKIHPVYYYFREGKNRNRLGQENNLLSLSYGKIVRKDINTSDGLLPENFNTYNIVEPNDIIIRPTDLQNDKRSLRTGLVYECGIITSAYICLRPIKKLDSRFFNYLLHAYDVIKVFYNMGNGVRQGLNFSEFSRLLVFEPPIEEQKIIAAFLNDKCAEIDSLTTDIQSQIDTLEQYKRSVITEAVTKGLNPDAVMKDSGIEWVGTIPAHWIVHPVYTYFGERKNKNRFGAEDNLLSLSYGRVIRKDINTSDGLLPESFNTYNIVEAGDIIIRPTDLQNDKRSLRTGLVKEHGIITSAYIDLCPIKKVDSRYFHFLLHAYDVMKVFYNMGNGVRQGLNYSEFSRLMVFEPRYEEQVAIADYLDCQCAEIDAIIAQKNEQLSTLESYKKSLIYEYVTGKKAVPEVGVSIKSVAIDPHVILAGMVIDRLGKNLKGKTEIQKILYLYDAYLGINPATQYYRYTHGPYDQNLDDYLNTLVANGWFQEISNGAIKYKKGPKHADFCSKYEDAFAEYSREMSKLISFVKGMKHTSQMERIATAFAVWNDLILEGNSSPTDDEIIREIRTNWTPNKAHSPESTWKGDLTKMKRQGIVPTGQGLHTLPMPKRGVCNE